MLKEKLVKFAVPAVSAGVAMLAMGTQFVISSDSLSGVSTAANDMATSLVANLAKIFPVLVPVLVVAFIIGLVIGIIRRR